MIPWSEKGRMKWTADTQCCICGTPAALTKTGRLVVDHNHATMMCRGLLCDRCNAWLSIYERHRLGQLNRVKWKKKHEEWASNYKENIEAHLRW